MFTQICWCCPNTDSPCRSKTAPGRGAAFLSSRCGYVYQIKKGNSWRALCGSGAAASPLGAGEQLVLRADGDGADGIFHLLVISGQRPRVSVLHQRRPALLALVDSLARAASVGHAEVGGDEPLPALWQQRLSLNLTQCHAGVGSALAATELPLVACRSKKLRRRCARHASSVTPRLNSDVVAGVIVDHQVAAPSAQERLGVRAPVV